MNRPFPWVVCLVTNLLWLGLAVVLWKGKGNGDVPASDAVMLRGTGMESSVLSGTGKQGERSVADGEGSAAAGKNVPVAEGIRSALAIKDPVERMASFAVLLRDLNLENLPEALKAFEESGHQEGDDALMVNFMRAWVRLDPKGAMDYALDNEGQRKFYVSNSDDKLIREWATRDPQAAMGYLDKIPADHKMNRRNLHTNLVRGMAATDLAGAASYAEENQYGRERGNSIEFLADTFMKKGGEDALRGWLDDIDKEGENKRHSYKEYAIVQAAEAMGRKDPDSAKALVEEYMGEGLVDGRALRAAADSVADRDPAEAVDWLMSVSEGKDRSYAVAETIEDWADDDPNAAGEWLSGQELGGEMDSAVSAFAREITRDDPVSAMAWGNIIGNEKQRAETLIRVGRDWARRDKGGFGQWLGQNEVPENVAKYFQRYIK